MDKVSFMKNLEGRLKESLSNEGYEVIYTKKMPFSYGINKEGICIEKPGTELGVYIYAEGIYQQYESGKTLDFIIDELMSMVKSKSADIDQHIFDKMTKEEVLKTIFPMVVSYKPNQSKIEKCPFRRVYNTELVNAYYCQVPSRDGKKVTLHISTLNMAEKGLTEEKLYRASLKNLEKVPYIFKNLPEIIRNKDIQNAIYGSLTDKNSSLYVLSNSECFYGAAFLLSNKVLTEISDYMGGDYVIIPSSVHELIIAAPNAIDTRVAVDLIQKISGFVPPKDRLMGSLYAYSKKCGLYVRAACF